MTDDSRLPDPPEWNWKEEQQERQAKAAEGEKSKESKPPTTTQALLERNIGIGIAIGYSFVGPVLGGIVLGLWLDRWNPGGFTILGLLLGMAGALALLIRLVARLNRDG